MKINCVVQKMKSKDQAAVEIFFVKEPSNLIGQTNFGTKAQDPDCWNN